MNKPLLVVASLYLALSLNAQTTYFVSPNASGRGSSWEDATNLHVALSTAQDGDQLWLRKGTYYTSTSGDRIASFVLPKGVTLLGGFTGTEKSSSSRKASNNRTILSGEIGSSAKHDNAYTVLSILEASAKTTVDGITITGGYANGAGPTADAKRAGGGVLVKTNRPGSETQPTFSNCTFEVNYARDGGAVYIDGRGAKARPSFISCIFKKNEADLDGGAIYNDGRRKGLANPSFVGCTFDGNVANYGGAVFNQATKGTSSPKFSDCTFRKNHAYVRGASLYNLDHQGQNRPSLISCIFEDLNQGGESVDDLARGN